MQIETFLCACGSRSPDGQSQLALSATKGTSNCFDWTDKQNEFDWTDKCNEFDWTDKCNEFDQPDKCNEFDKYNEFDWTLLQITVFYWSEVSGYSPEHVAWKAALFVFVPAALVLYRST